MIFASHPTKKSKASNSPAVVNAEATNPVEQALREAADWEPHCPPPADFAAFTRCALENRNRTPFSPPSSRPAPNVQWVRGLRAPLAASLALGLVLWVGGSVNDLNYVPLPDQMRETATKTTRPVLYETPAALTHASQTTEKYGPLVQTAEKAYPVAPDIAQASRSRVALTSQRAPIHRHKSHDAGRAEKMLATQGTKQTNPAPLWKTETVERPAWGALIPATFTCSTPASSEPGQDDETETTLMPVVLDVALPETASLASATGPSSTDAPPPTITP